jgi:hypothetical protein
MWRKTYFLPHIISPIIFYLYPICDSIHNIITVSTNALNPVIQIISRQVVTLCNYQCISVVDSHNHKEEAKSVFVITHLQWMHGSNFQFKVAKNSNNRHTYNFLKVYVTSVSTMLTLFTERNYLLPTQWKCKYSRSLTWDKILQWPLTHGFLVFTLHQIHH